MKKTYKIGWQKYEDVLESQINSPIIDKLYDMILNKAAVEDDQLDLTEEELQELNMAAQPVGDPVMLNIDENLAGEIAIASNFECWVAHTNFNLTEKIKDQLDKIEGIELLKVFSRYRFLVGVGKMFDFSDVRRSIEKKICTKEQGEKT